MHNATIITVGRKNPSSHSIISSFLFFNPVVQEPLRD